MRVRILQADPADHKAISLIAHQSKYTKAFTNQIFSGADCYAEGRIKVAVKPSGKIVGFTCFRHRKRNGPVTVLYFVGVDAELRSQGVGTQLMNDLWKICRGGVEFNVMKDNPAVSLYNRLGFEVVGEAYEGKALVMRKNKPC